MIKVLEILMIVNLIILPIFVLWSMISDIFDTDYMIKRKRYKSFKRKMKLLNNNTYNKGEIK